MYSTWVYFVTLATTTTSTAGFFTLWATKTSLRAAHGFISNSYQICRPVWAERQQQSRSVLISYMTFKVTATGTTISCKSMETPATVNVFCYCRCCCVVVSDMQAVTLLTSYFHLACTHILGENIRLPALEHRIQLFIWHIGPSWKWEKYVRAAFWLKDVHMLRNVAGEPENESTTTPPRVEIKRETSVFPLLSVICEVCVIWVFSLLLNWLLYTMSGCD